MQIRIWGYVLASLGACAAPSDAPIDVTFDPCHPPRIASDAGASAVQVAGIADAEALWQLGPTGVGALDVRFEPAADAFHGLYDDQAGIIYINDHLSDPPTLAIVIAHELGHAFGLHHVSPDVRASLMNPGNLVVPPTDADRRALAALWGACAAGS